MKADLHVHSNFSDGSDNLQELVEKIQQAKIEVFALTDHDTIEGCVEIEPLIPDSIKFIPSIELTCLANDIKCHILGFNCNPYDEKLNNLIKKGKDLRKQKLETRIKYLSEVWNINLTDTERDWLYSRESVVKTHLANIIVARGLATDNVSAMKKYLDPCKTGPTRFDINEAIDAIISSGGIPFWAHPLGGEGEKHFGKEEFLPKLEKMIKFGIKGLECYYSRYSMQECEFLVNCANENNLLISGGSDYHGTNKNNINLAKLNINNEPVDSSFLTVLNKI